MKSGDVLVAYSRRFVNETCRRAKALEFLTYIRIFFEIIHEYVICLHRVSLVRSCMIVLYDDLGFIFRACF